VTYRIRFNQPYIAGGEGVQAARCLASGETSGDGAFSKECQRLLCGAFGARSVLLTTSCTSALELAALLCDLEPGDEVILPSYTFVSTANAFLLRGATLKFVDVRPDTLNLDEQLVAAAAGPRTKVIVAVHYAGVACEMDSIRATADRHGALVVEDAAQAVNATYKGSHLGTLAPLGAYSFHATKNFSCGEGGALVVNDARLVERAEIMREKGTNRSRFYRGQVDDDLFTRRHAWFLSHNSDFVFLAVLLNAAGHCHCTRKRDWLLQWNRQRGKNVAHHINLVGFRKRDDVTRLQVGIGARVARKRLAQFITGERGRVFRRSV